MLKQFVKLQLSVVEPPLYVNVADIRAVLPLGGDKYQVWFLQGFTIPETLLRRENRAEGAASLTQDSWEACSTDMAELLDLVL